jgi:hypothetical protein
MIADNQVFTKKMKIPWRIIDNEAVIVDLSGNCVLQLNDIGRHIWERIDGAARVAGIVDSIIEAYDIDRGAALKDAVRFIGALVEKGLIHAVSPEAEHS